MKSKDKDYLSDNPSRRCPIIDKAENAKFESKPNFNGRNLIVILVKNS